MLGLSGAADLMSFQALVENPFFAPALVLVLAIMAQWVAWRFRLPSILVLLVFGIVAGYYGIVNTDALLGDLLKPVVAFSVALIIFEGSLGLEMEALRNIGRVVWNMHTHGALVAWLLGAAALHYVAGVNLQISLLLGAILIITGPTAVLPLLLYIRPTGQVSQILRWEGILIAPVGALLSVFVFEAILSSGSAADVTFSIVTGFLRFIFFGVFTGLVAGWLLIRFLTKNWIPDYLQNPMALMTVIATYTTANLLQADSGLVAAVVLGIYLANQRIANIKHIVEFKENLRLLLLSILFILLAARMDMGVVAELGWGSWLFIALLIFVIRPVWILVSTFRSNVRWQDRLYLSLLAPRGVTSASIAAIFALELAEAGYPDTELIVPILFMVILCSVTFCSLTAVPVARALGIIGNPQGVLIVGSQSWARTIGRVIQSQGLRVLMADTNLTNIMRARKEGLETYYGDVLADYVFDEVDLTGVGHLLALTPNNQVNSLVALHFQDAFGKEEVYQLPPLIMKDVKADNRNVPQQLRGRQLFSDEANFWHLDDLFDHGAEVQVIEVTKDFDYERYVSEAGYTVIPLFVVSETGILGIVTTDTPLSFKPGHKLICVVAR